MTRFTKDDAGLFGVFGLSVDETTHTLWAATSALPEMAGFAAEMKGRAGLAEIDLESGEVRRVVWVPVDGRDHVLGDLVVADDGMIYLTDSVAPVVWRYLPTGAAVKETSTVKVEKAGKVKLEKWVESPSFASLQGLAVFGGRLLVSDYANGLVVIDRSAKEVLALAPPEGTTLLGLDGMVRGADGRTEIFGVQNGIAPQRLVHVILAEDLSAVRRVDVLAANLAGMSDLSLVTRVKGKAVFIAGAGWDGFDAGKTTEPTAHRVRVMGVEGP